MWRIRTTYDKRFAGDPQGRGVLGRGVLAGAAPRTNGAKRTYRWVLESLRSLRHELVKVPAGIVAPERPTELRLAAAPETQQRITRILAALSEAA